MTNEEAIATLKAIRSEHNIKRNGLIAIDLAITVLEKDSRRGKWIDEPIKGVRYHCSLCSGRHDYEWPYCPSCGADMREATE